MPITTKFSQKCDRGSQKTANFVAMFVKRPTKPLGNILRTQKSDRQFVFFSELQELEVRICVKPKIHIIILSLLTLTLRQRQTHLERFSDLVTLVLNIPDK